MADPIYAITLEASPGSMTNVSTDVTRFSFDRAIARIDRSLRPDNAMIELQNAGGKYAPKRGGPIGSGLLPGRMVSIQATHRRRYLGFTGSGYAWSPNSDAVEAGSNDLIAEAYFHLADLTPSVQRRVIDKVGVYRMTIQTTGFVGFGVFDGTALVLLLSDAALPFSPIHVRAYMDFDNGAGERAVIFSVSSDGGVSWNQLGSTITSSGTIPVPVLTNIQPLGVAATGAGAAQAWGSGDRFYYAELRDAVTGQRKFHFDAEDFRVGQNSAVSRTTGEVWSVEAPAFIAEEDGGTYPLFYGRILRTQSRPTVGDHQITVVEALSDADRLKRTTLTSSLFRDINAASLFTEIMSLSNVASFSSDQLFDEIPYAWYQDRPATDAIQELIESGNYNLFIDGGGVVRLKSRYGGFFANVVGSLDQFYDLSYTLDPDAIINSLKLNTVPRAQATTVNTIAVLAGGLTIPASGSVGFWLTFQDPEAGNVITPVGSMITPVASQDYYASVNSDGSGGDLTSALTVSFQRFGATVVCSIFNGGGTEAQLVRFQLRGYPVRGLATLGFKYDSSSSQQSYGVRALEVSNALIQDYNYLRDLAQTLVEERRAPQDGLDFTLVNEFPQVLQYEVADRLSVVNSVTGVNSEWFIGSMRHDVSFVGGLRHEANYTGEYYQDRPWLILDDPEYGKLDNGRQLAL